MRKLRLFRSKDNLVFAWPQGQLVPREENPAIPGRFIAVTHESISRWFHEDSERTDKFRSFINAGCRGVVRVDDERWISYAWMSTPGSRVGPEQIPLELRSPYHWIYYCRTREEYRGRGLYKESLKALVQDALESGRNSGIMIDTEPANVASRRAILSVGFAPNGIIRTKELIIPRIKKWTWGAWDLEKAHL